MDTRHSRQSSAALSRLLRACTLQSASQSDRCHIADCHDGCLDVCVCVCVCVPLAAARLCRQNVLHEFSAHFHRSLQLRASGARRTQAHSGILGHWMSVMLRENSEARVDALTLRCDAITLTTSLVVRLCCVPFLQSSPCPTTASRPRPSKVHDRGMHARDRFKILHHACAVASSSSRSQRF